MAGFVAAGVLVTAGALVSAPLPGLVISGAGGGVSAGAGGAAAGGGISGSVEASGVLVAGPGEGGGAVMPLLEPDWFSAP